MTQPRANAGLTEQLDRARAEVAMLERKVASASCAEVGHRWESIGGCNCGCDCEKDGACSLPVNRCAVCSDYDYGSNTEAEQIRVSCVERRALETGEAREQHKQEEK